MNESISAKFKRFYNTLDEFIEEDLAFLNKAYITIDFLIEKIFHDIELIDYIQYRFYYKRKVERRKFATHGELIRVIKACNNPEHKKIFDDKLLFNKSFNNYLGRAWISGKNKDKEEIKEFVNKHRKVFMKDPKGMFGKGIKILTNKDLTDELLDYIISSETLLEEQITQYEELSKFNESSVNSLRVVTLHTINDGIKVMAGVLRVGRKGKFADNFHHNGIASLIDINTGLVYTTGVDRNFERYVKHPDSDKEIVGYKVPKWDDIKCVVKKAASVYPDIRYVGWDVTIKDNGEIVLIEGNPGGDFDITQIPDQVGKWPLFEPYIEQIESGK